MWELLALGMQFFSVPVSLYCFSSVHYIFVVGLKRLKQVQIRKIDQKMFLVGHCQQNKNLRFSKMLQGTSASSLFTDDLLNNHENWNTSCQFRWKLRNPTKQDFHFVFSFCYLNCHSFNVFSIPLIHVVRQYAVFTSLCFFLTFRVHIYLLFSG